MAHAPGRVLLAEAAGEPNHGTRGPALEPMVRLLTGLQERSVGRTDELLARGVPDRRLALMLSRVEAVAATSAAALPPSQQRALRALVADLPRRVAEVEACGMPETLVHGDFHPGNVVGRRRATCSSTGATASSATRSSTSSRSPSGSWARSGPPPVRWFVDAWRRIAPGADPDRAADLLRPVLPLSPR